MKQKNNTALSVDQSTQHRVFEDKSGVINTIGYEMTGSGSYPRIRCVICGDIIQRAHLKTAIVQWSETGQIAFTHGHPLTCSDCLDYQNGFPSWEPIEVFFHNLLNNTGIGATEFQKAEEYQEMFGTTGGRLDPQATLCSSGQNKKLNVKKHFKKMGVI